MYVCMYVLCTYVCKYEANLPVKKPHHHGCLALEHATVSLSCVRDFLNFTAPLDPIKKMLLSSMSKVFLGK